MGVTLDELYNECNRLFLYNTDGALNILSEGDRKDLIRSAVKEYSKRRPDTALNVYTAVGASTYWYDLPTDYEIGFSQIINIEYRIDQAPPSYLNPKNYGEDSGTSGWQLRFLRSQPTNSEVFWMRYSKRYVFDSDFSSDIPEADKIGLAWLCLAIWCEAMSDYYASRADPNLENAEVIGQPSRHAESLENAKHFREKYDETIVPDNNSVYGKIGFQQDSFWDRDND